MEEGILYYDEVFESIQGESTDAGKPCVFVRLYGCNVKCSFCDQPQKPTNRHKISIANMVSKVLKYRIKNICITGGEPLIQWDSVYQLALELISYDCSVSIETNGCVEIKDAYCPRRFKYVMDIKCPSSGVSHRNIFENLMKLSVKDEVKFVISDHQDYVFAKKVLKDYPTSAKILFSPVFNFDSKGNFVTPVGKDLSKWVVADKMENARLQIQMHKCLGVK